MYILRCSQQKPILGRSLSYERANKFIFIFWDIQTVHTDQSFGSKDINYVKVQIISFISPKKEWISRKIVLDWLIEFGGLLQNKLRFKKISMSYNPIMNLRVATSHHTIWILSSFEASPLLSCLAEWLYQRFSKLCWFLRHLKEILRF